MSNRIIKDFNGWSLLTEDSDSSSGLYTGSRSDSVGIYTGSKSNQSELDKTDSYYSASSDSGSADSGSYYSGPSDSDPSDSDDSLDADSRLSGAKDEKLTVDDIKKIQAVVFGVDLTDIETCDGIVGQTTVDKIKEFRTKYEITGDDGVEPNQTAVGPLTLAKISKLIKTGDYKVKVKDKDKVEPNQKTDDSSTLSKISKIIKSVTK